MKIQWNEWKRKEEGSREEGACLQHPLVRVDFGNQGVWLVPLDELVAVWQPPSLRHPRGRKEWLAAKRAARKEERPRERWQE